MSEQVDKSDIAFLNASEIASLIKRRKIGCVEILDHIIKRVDAYNPKLNAIVEFDLDRARASARAADQAVLEGRPLAPLHGVPMTVKESFNISGLRTTWGLPAYANNVASQNALAVDRLLKAGAIIFGKTNVPPSLADSQAVNEIYGTTCNPWDLSRSPGGSSGGSAAALAAGLTFLEVGSDVAGSIRNPANYCGVFGLKPTYGVCPATGHSIGVTLVDDDISVIGPLARSPADLELALRAIAGPDEILARAYSFRLPDPRKRSLDEFRVAIVTDDKRAEVDQEIQDKILELGEFLKREHALVSFSDRPQFDTADLDAIYMMMVRAAASVRLTDDGFEEAMSRGKECTTGETDSMGNMLHGITMSHREWLQRNEQRHRMRLLWDKFFDEFDVLLCPIAVSGAFPHSDVSIDRRSLFVNGRNVPYTDQLFWAGYPGLCYLPAVVAPIGFTRNGLPVGVQIVARQYDDRTCIEFAKLIERDYQAFEPPPDFL